MCDDFETYVKIQVKTFNDMYELALLLSNSKFKLEFKLDYYYHEFKIDLEELYSKNKNIDKIFLKGISVNILNENYDYYKDYASDLESEINELHHVYTNINLYNQEKEKLINKLDLVSKILIDLESYLN